MFKVCYFPPEDILATERYYQNRDESAAKAFLNKAIAHKSS